MDYIELCQLVLSLTLAIMLGSLWSLLGYMMQSTFRLSEEITNYIVVIGSVIFGIIGFLIGQNLHICQ